MTTQGRQLLMLALLTLGLGGTVWYQLRDATPASSPGATSNRTRAATARTAGTSQVAEVRLEALQARNDTIGPPTRDPFRFRMKPAPPPPPPPPPLPPGPPRPLIETRPGPPPPPPITLKYLGYAMNTSGTRVAVLQDGVARPPLFGKQGDVIEGRYRLLAVDADNVEIAYLDGTGRRRIPKTGQ